MVYSAVARLVGIIAQNILLCDSSDNTGWRGGGAVAVHLPSLTCVACWERVALCVVPLFCAGPGRLPC